MVRFYFNQGPAIIFVCLLLAPHSRVGGTTPTPFHHERALAGEYTLVRVQDNLGVLAAFEALESALRVGQVHPGADHRAHVQLAGGHHADDVLERAVSSMTERTGHLDAALLMG